MAQGLHNSKAFEGGSSEMVPRSNLHFGQVGGHAMQQSPVPTLILFWHSVSSASCVRQVYHVIHVG